MCKNDDIKSLFEVAVLCNNAYVDETNSIVVGKDFKIFTRASSKYYSYKKVHYQLLFVEYQFDPKEFKWPPWSFTGWPVCIGTMGVASKPVEPHPQFFPGFFIYIKKKFVANLKLIGAFMLT